jgi:serine/threonine protein phosphatase PrpC
MRLMISKVEYFGTSDVGLVRENNEDVFAALPDESFFILADGMGGHNAGEVAASVAVESVCASMKALPNEATVEETCQLLREALADANRKVFDQARRNREYAGMGTTLSCFVLLEDVLIYAHVGDSRLYRYRSKLEQLTQDHSLRKEDDAKHSRHMITRAVGHLPTILPDIGVIPLRPKDIYMLCSDGLSDYVPENTVARVLASPLKLEEMGEKLVESALEKGGNDNITLLLVKIQ